MSGGLTEDGETSSELGEHVPMSSSSLFKPRTTDSTIDSVKMGTLTRNSRGLLDVLLENYSLTGRLSKKGSLSVFSTWHDEYLAGGYWPSLFSYCNG